MKDLTNPSSQLSFLFDTLTAKRVAYFRNRQTGHEQNPNISDVSCLSGIHKK